MSDPDIEVTQFLENYKVQEGQDPAEMIGLVYNELKALAHQYLAGERANHTLQPTALVHEAYARLMENKRMIWQDRGHFFAMAARVMRRVLVDYARRARADKRGDPALHITLNDEMHGLDGELRLEVLDEALRELAQMDQRQCRIVELRFFTGLTIKECAAILNISPRTVNSEWQMARAWLFGRLSEGSEP